MEREIKIVIPSHKRVGRVTTHKVVRSAVLCVPESQAEDYQAAYPSVGVGDHPDTIIGLAPKRQWIYDQFGDICMLDDDLTAIHRNYVGRHSTLTPDEAFDLVQWTGNVAALAGCFLAGWSSYPKPMHYDGLEPITMRGFINGCAMIVLSGSQLFWDGQFTAVEDYFVCALNAHFHRKAFIDNRFTWIQTDTFKNRGGQADHRTMETEARDTLLLRRYFGSAIVAKRVEYGKGAGRGMRTKVKNPFGRSLKLPF